MMEHEVKVTLAGAGFLADGTSTARTPPNAQAVQPDHSKRFDLILVLFGVLVLVEAPTIELRPGSQGILTVQLAVLLYPWRHGGKEATCLQKALAVWFAEPSCCLLCRGFADVCIEPCSQRISKSRSSRSRATRPARCRHRGHREGGQKDADEGTI
eukprot:symbB.v1.2.010267.t1/scaffold619.1/size180033/3